MLQTGPLTFQGANILRLPVDISFEARDLMLKGV
jgi:hypothetical protein